ncbi:MAG: PorT family protein [Lentimicrobiaceae bacterium]|nr:PorT family protein [Lentimicrobiaceae bacterium]
MKKLQVTSYELKVTGYKLQVTSYKLRFLLSAFCLLLSAFCFLPSTLFAQKSSSSLISENKSVFLGLSFGPTIDWFAPTTDKFTFDREKAKGGFIAGINLDITLKKESFIYFSTGVRVRYLQGELSFSNRYDFKPPIDTSFIVPTVRTYQTTYLTVPTGINFRTKPLAGCVFLAKLGLYHNFRIGGTQYDSFTLPGGDPNYFTTTKKRPNKDASLFAEAGYLGVGFEYAFKEGTRIFANVDYSCQFNYFSAKTKDNVSNERFKSIVHSLHIVFGFLF